MIERPWPSNSLARANTASAPSPLIADTREEIDLIYTRSFTFADPNQLIAGEELVLLLRQRHHAEPALMHEWRVGKFPVRFYFGQGHRLCDRFTRVNLHGGIPGIRCVYGNNLGRSHGCLLIAGVIYHQPVSRLHGAKIFHS